MSDLKIITDHKWKNFLYGYELTKWEQKDFDHLSQEEIDSGAFFRYRKQVYSLEGFMVIMGPENPLKSWDGYQSDSYFSGVVLRVSKDGEQYQVGLYLS
jgi:hypothetical protein